MSGTSAATYWNHNSAFHGELVADAARRGGRALDVGCGEGLLVQRLAAVCEEAVGIEADPATVEALPVVKTYEESTKYVTKRYGTPWSSELDQLLSCLLYTSDAADE